MATHDARRGATAGWGREAALAAACGLLGALAAASDGAASRALAAAACAAGGWDAAGEALDALRARRADVHLLMLLAAAGAWGLGQPMEATLLLCLFSAAGAIERYAMERSRGAIEALLDGSPRRARRVEADGSEHEVPVESLRPGDVVAILPGELVPADCVAESGASEADESNLTGEARPVRKGPGDALSGGTLNGWGRLTARVTRTQEDSALHRIVRLIREAQESKAPAQRTIDRWGDRYAAFTLAASAALFAARLWSGTPAVSGEDSALYRALTLLVVLSPCALVLSVPSAVLAAIAAGARNGILFRGGAAVERLADVDCACFDKTGTLTTGEPEVASLEVSPAGADRARALSALLSLEAGTTHPFAAAVVRACEREGGARRPVAGLSVSPGQGVSGSVEGRRWSAGNREFAGCPALPQAPTDPGAIVSEVWASDGEVTVRATLVDRIREESAPMLAELARRGVRTVMLTGDREEAAAAAARQVGVGSYRAALTPEAKLAAIRALSAEGRVVAMVGDGVNDAPGLAAADVAVGMGGRGCDAALESSDVVLPDDRIGRLVDAIELSRAARRAIRVNVTVSVAAALGMAGYVIAAGAPLTVGVAVHEGSTVLVCLNGLRLLAFRPARRSAQLLA
ncbi:MAG: heavy metal translocating P-type ATPase [Opitutia bacterium]